MSTKDKDGEFGRGHSGSAWEPDTTHATDYPLGPPRPFYLPPKAMEASLRGSVNNMELHLARGRAGRIVQEALDGQTPAEPTQAQAFAKSLVAQIPADKRSLLSELTAIRQKGPMMRRPNEQALLAENESWFGQYQEGLDQIVSVERVALQNQIAPKGKPVLLAIAGDKLPVDAVASSQSTHANRSANHAVAPTRAAVTNLPSLSTDELSSCATEEETEFKKQVYNEHVRRTKARNGEFSTGVETKDLETVEHGYSMEKSAAVAAKKLLAAAHVEWEKQKVAKEPHALRVQKFNITSGYRDPKKDFGLWEHNYNQYAGKTQAQRQNLPGGEYGPAAVKLLVEKISPIKAAPGYSNHTRGLAFDLTTEEKTDEAFTFPGSDATERKHAVGVGKKFSLTADAQQNELWRTTWIYQWLEAHAAEYDFYRIPSEAWHWEYKPSSSSLALPSR